MTPIYIENSQLETGPFYASGKSNVCENCREAFEELLIENNVDLVMSGHFHIYERNTPINNGTSDPNGLNNPSSPWYITNGAGGHYDGLDSFDSPLQDYQVFGLSTENKTYGWSKLTFHNCTHLTHDFIASNNNSVIDTATLFKNRTCSLSGSGGSSSSAPASTSTVISSNSSVSTSSLPLTTSTVYTTSVITITHCATTVTNCPARSTEVITSTIALYTVCCSLPLFSLFSSH